MRDVKLIMLLSLIAAASVIGCNDHGASVEVGAPDGQSFRWLFPDGDQCASLRYDSQAGIWDLFTDYGNWDGPHHYFPSKEKALEFARNWCPKETK